MSGSSAAQWVKFFNAAGIPSPAAATYAHKFVENRIQNDMLMDLNKEYLREMEISRMGDIIAILRHAKTVSDQTARDKVLNNETFSVPIAAVPANPVLPPEKSTKIKLREKLSSKAVLVSPMPKPPARRVLPEHEGKYKIKLPTGSTQRSKEILAKRAKLYSDREALSKSDVFKRLSKDVQVMELDEDDYDEHDNSNDDNHKSNNVKIRVTGLGNNKAMAQSSSIFARLGDKTEGAKTAKQIKPILKNTTKTTGIIKAKSSVSPSTVARPQKQKVLLVKKVPIKTSDSDYDDYDSNDDNSRKDVDDLLFGRSNSTEKIVKFASTAEVREIAPEPKFHASNRNSKGGIKARLDLTTKLHTTRRSFNLKASPPQNKRLIKGKSMRLKSEEWLLQQELPVHQRLGQRTATASSLPSSSTFNAANAISTLSKRIGSVNISTQKRYSLSSANGKQREANNGSTTSVFDRLGFTK